jgi:hypothetical protein
LILRPPPRPATPAAPADCLAARLPAGGPRHALLDPALTLLPSLYRLLPPDAILAALADTGAASRRVRRLPAHDVVWLVVAASLFRGRSLPMVWRHVRPSSDAPAPADSAFTQARQRLGASPMKLLFHRTCRPLAAPGAPGCFHGRWRVVALDGSVFEAPDTRANRRALGSASNQGGEGAYPQLRLAAVCEAGTHAVTDAEFGPYAASEQALALRLLRRLPAGRLVLMDRGLSYYGLVEAVLRRKSHVLARVKVSRALPVERALPDGSYLSTIYPSFDDRRAGRGGVRVRVVRYTHDDPLRAGAGEGSVLITTVLDAAALGARRAVLLYPWRWEVESAFAEIKAAMLQNGQPLLRGKTPGLVAQEVYGLLIGHYLVRREMARSAEAARVEAARLSFERSMGVLEDRMRDGDGDEWLEGLRREIGRQRLRPRRPRRYPRVRKGGRSRWPNKKPGAKPPPRQAKPFAEFMRILQTDEH